VPELPYAIEHGAPSHVRFEIGPELEAAHAARLIPFRHFLVDPASKGFLFLNFK
jgi:hypothetical protein